LVVVVVMTAVWGRQPPRKRFAEDEYFEEDDVPARPRRAAPRLPRALPPQDAEGSVRARPRPPPPRPPPPRADEPPPPPPAAAPPPRRRGPAGAPPPGCGLLPWIIGGLAAAGLVAVVGGAALLWWALPSLGKPGSAPAARGPALPQAGTPVPPALPPLAAAP